MQRETIGRPMEILLVEDGLLDARLTMAALQKSGVKHRLTLTRDGLEAMRFLQREGEFARAPRPDLILLDLHLPKKDGREVLDEVKNDDDLKQIPVVVLTASDDPEDRERSQILHVDGYMTKPVDYDKFLEVVRELRRFWLADIVLPRMEWQPGAETMSGKDRSISYGAEPTRAEIDALPGPVLVEFGADWCGFCQAFQPALTQALARYPQVRHIKVADGRGQPLGRSFGVKLWPTLVFLRNGQSFKQISRPAIGDAEEGLSLITAPEQSR